MTNSTLALIEFETKYRVEDYQLIEFEQLIDQIEGEKSFIFVKGPDYYFTYPDWWFAHNTQYDPNGTFARYRKPYYGLDNDRRQVTWKYKPADSKNNISRTEHNWNINNTPEETILKQLELSNLTFNFSIVKNCHIYKLHDATLVFYTVYDTTDGNPKKADSFLEIEVDEDIMHKITEPEAWAIIEKYEKLLAKLGISPQKRLRKSLFEMYVRKK